MAARLTTGHQKETSSKASSRRYACDRCRGHKLRCNRDLMHSGSGPCQRCIRAKAACTVNYSVRPGKTQALGRDGGARPDPGRNGCSEEESIQLDRHIGTSLRQQGYQSGSQSSELLEPFDTPFDSATLLLQAPEDPPMESHGHSEGCQYEIADTNARGAFPEFEFEENHLQQPFPSDNPRDQPSISTGIQTFNGCTDISTLTQANIETSMVPSYEFTAGYLPLNPFHAQDLQSTRTVGTTVSQAASTDSLSLEGQREMCIQRLSEVNAVLMKNLTRLTTCVVATTFIFTPSDQITSDYLFKTIDGSSGQDNAIGDVFRSTAEFIRIIHDFRDALLDFTPQTARDLADAYGNDATVNANGEAKASVEENGVDEVLNRWNLLSSYKDRTQGHPISQHPVFTVPNSPSTILRAPRLSITSTLTLLTCYVCILKSFQSIFISLQAWLSIPASSPLHEQLAPIIAGVQINTFALDSSGDRAMQFKILLQTCEHMLDKMEKALQFNFGEGGDSQTVFADPAFRGMLGILLKQEGLQTDSPDEDITGTRKLRRLLKKIGEELDRN